MANLLTYRGGQYRSTTGGAIKTPPPEYGTIEPRAKQQLGQTIADIGEDLLTKEGAKELSDYQANKIKLLSEWNTEVQTKGLTDTDGSQFEAYAKKREPDLFANFTWNPAKNKAKMDWTQIKAAGKAESAAQGLKRQADNLDSEYLVKIDEAVKFTAPPGDFEAGERIDTIRDYIAEAQRQNLPNFRDPAKNQVLLETSVKAVVSQLVLEDAKSDPKALDQANDYIENQGFQFSTDEIADLKKRYLDNQRLAGASVKAQSEQIESDLSSRIVALNFSKPQTFEEVEALRREIATNKLLDGTQIRELSHFLDSQITNAGKSADENDSDALAEAYKTMTSTMNQKQKFEKLMSLKPKLKNTTVDGFIQDIYKPDTVSNEIYKAYSSAITSLQTGKMFSTETTQNINLSVKAHDLLRLFAEQNPDATEEEYAKFFNRLIENQTSAWSIMPGGKSFWNSLRREKGELRYSIPRNIEALQKEIGKTKQYKIGDKRTINGVTYTYDGQYWTD